MTDDQGRASRQAVSCQSEQAMHVLLALQLSGGKMASGKLDGLLTQPTFRTMDRGSLPNPLYLQMRADKALVALVEDGLVARHNRFSSISYSLTPEGSQRLEALQQQYPLPKAFPVKSAEQKAALQVASQVSSPALSSELSQAQPSQAAAPKPRKSGGAYPYANTTDADFRRGLGPEAKRLFDTLRAAEARGAANHGDEDGEDRPAQGRGR